LFFLIVKSPRLNSCWLGLSTCKNHLPYNLYRVGGNVKRYSTNQLNSFVQMPADILSRWEL